MRSGTYGSLLMHVCVSMEKVQCSYTQHLLLCLCALFSAEVNILTVLKIASVCLNQPKLDVVRETL